MYTKYLRKGGKALKDDLVIKDLKAALSDYENGAIVECADTLRDIVCAIEDFEPLVEF